MKIITETSLEKFEFWSGAKYTAERITEAGKWDELEEILKELYPDGVNETELNDLLWFDSDYIYELLGMEEDE